MAYHLISTTSATVLDDEVNNYERQGWKLHGKTFSHNGLLCQPMVKKSEKKKTMLESLYEEEQTA